MYAVWSELIRYTDYWFSGLETESGDVNYEIWLSLFGRVGFFSISPYIKVYMESKFVLIKSEFLNK